MKKIFQLKTMILMLLFLILILQLPFHYNEAQFESVIYKEIKSKGYNIEINQIHYVKEKEKGLLNIYVFDFAIDGKQNDGTAIFVKNMILPLYRLENVYVEKNNKELDYTHAVTDSREINVVEIKGDSIKIPVSESIFMKKLLTYIFYFAIYLIIFRIKVKWYKAKS